MLLEADVQRPSWAEETKLRTPAFLVRKGVNTEGTEAIHDTICGMFEHCHCVILYFAMRVHELTLPQPSTLTRSPPQVGIAPYATTLSTLKRAQRANHRLGASLEQELQNASRSGHKQSTHLLKRIRTMKRHNTLMIEY